MLIRKRVSVTALAFFALLPLPTIALGQANNETPASNAAEAPMQQAAAQRPPLLVCGSQPGERNSCAADTSRGVALVRSTGAGPCLLGKSWGYDDKSVWVSDGCSGEFVVGEVIDQLPEKQPAPDYVPNAGFKIFDGEKGQMYVRLFSYARYLNQRNLNDTYTDAFGNTKSVTLRQDVQLQKFFLPFSGWFMSPKFRYYLYVWSANTSQGDAAQVVGGGNISYTFNRFVTFGAGITSLPSVRSTEGQFPYWLTVDTRLIADEYFRGSYTSGVWLKGDIGLKLKYHAMFANNLSTLGVSAAQLDNKMQTQSFGLQWMPTTGEFGLWNTFGDYDDHQKFATRVGLHFTHSREEKQTQPGTDGIENSQIRLSDGSIIFTPNLFAQGTTVDSVRYKMTSIDAGLKYHGMSLEGEVYKRWLDDYTGANVGIVPDIADTGYQMQASAMVVPKILQTYVGWSQLYGDYGDPWEVRGGANWYFLKTRGVRVNGEFINVHGSPVGYTAYPMPVGATGKVFHFNLEMNF